MIYIVHYKL